jgi:hypothetical protein
VRMAANRAPAWTPAADESVPADGTGTYGRF